MDMKEDQQKFFEKKTGSGAKASESVYNIIFGQQIQLKWDQCVKYLLWVIDVFTKYVWFKHLKDREAKTALHDFVEIVNQNANQINYRLIKEDNFAKDLFQNGETIMMFSCTLLIMKVS